METNESWFLETEQERQIAKQSYKQIEWIVVDV